MGSPRCELVYILHVFHNFLQGLLICDVHLITYLPLSIPIVNHGVSRHFPPPVGGATFGSATRQLLMNLQELLKEMYCEAAILDLIKRPLSLLHTVVSQRLELNYGRLWRSRKNNCALLQAYVLACMAMEQPSAFHSDLTPGKRRWGLCGSLNSQHMF